jgi:hypothetical protein
VYYHWLWLQLHGSRRMDAKQYAMTATRLKADVTSSASVEVRSAYAHYQEHGSFDAVAAVSSIRMRRRCRESDGLITSKTKHAVVMEPAWPRSARTLAALPEGLSFTCANAKIEISKTKLVSATL